MQLFASLAICHACMVHGQSVGANLESSRSVQCEKPARSLLVGASKALAMLLLSFNSIARLTSNCHDAISSTDRQSLVASHPRPSDAVVHVSKRVPVVGMSDKLDKLSFRERFTLEAKAQSFRDMLEEAQQKLGLEHPTTLKVMIRYADVIDQLGFKKEAEGLKRYAEQVRGEAPPAVMEDYSLFEATGKKLAIAMFDFDQTLTTEHVFNTLSNMEERVTGEPVAVSPAGQVSRLTNEHEKYNALWAFGGAERLSALRDMLQRLQDRGVKMMVCTLGYPASVKMLLEEADLLKYFGWDGAASIVGAAGEAYEDFFTAYDVDAAKQHIITEHPDEILEISKVALLDDLLNEEGKQQGMKLPLSAGVIVEDDPKAIRHAKRYVHKDAYERIVSKGHLNTVEVTERKGLQPEVEMKHLLEIADA